MTGVQVAAPPTPFKGLAPFDDSALDALFFFGRAREIEVIAANVMANRLTVLYGPSGVGKTSLLRAGVARRLRQDSDSTVAVASSWAGDPVAAVLEAIEAATSADGRPVENVRRAGSLADVLSAVVRRLDTNVYLLLDQFEEYFLYHGGERGPESLTDALGEALRRGGLRANFLLGIREDSLAQLDAFKATIPNRFAHTLRLDRLDRQAGEAAIVGPIREYNRLHPAMQMEVEPELVATVLSEVAAGRVALGVSGRGEVGERADAGIEAPYLQLVLERLWDVETGRGSRRLSLETLRELGGSAQIVRDHLDRAMSELSPVEQDAAAAMYNHLVTPSGTKIAHRARDLAGYANVDDTEAERVLRRLAGERIVRAGENGASGPRYEIFHDVLAGAVLAWRTRHEADRRLETERATAARRHKRTLAFAVVATAAVAILAAVSVYALVQRGNARTEARHARARELAALATSQLAVDPERSLRLAVQANAVEQSSQSEDVLRSTLRDLRVRAVLPGGEAVSDAEFSPRGELALTASANGEARLFRADSGLRVRTFRHGAPLAAAHFSPDGSVVVTAGQDGVARIWNARTGARLRELRHDGPVTSATFSRDGRLLATTSADRTARIWDAGAGRLLRRLEHPAAVKSASFSADAALLVTVVADAARDRVARVFDVRTGRLVQRLVQPARERVTSAQFAPSGDNVVTGSGHLAARVWNARTGKLLHELDGHKAAVLDAEFSPAGDLIATASADQEARVWNAGTGDLVTPLAYHKGHVVHARFSRDGQSVVTASDDKKAAVFDVDSGYLLAALVGHTDSVTDAAFSPDGTTVLTASKDGTARLWDPLAFPALIPLGAPQRGLISSLAFSPDGKLVASAGEDGKVRLWRYRGRLLRTFTTGGATTGVAFSPDGSLVLAASTDGKARVWRTGTGALVATLRHPRPVVAAALSPDSRIVATADAGGLVRVWALATGRPVRQLPLHGPIASVSFSPDGRLLATGGADRVARLWRVEDGSLVHELRGHTDGVVTASFSGDGRRLVTASRDGTARIWDAQSGALQHVLRGHSRPLTSASFSPNGRLVATTSLDGESRVWFAATGSRAFEPLRQAQAVSGAAFSADSRWLVTAGPSAGVWDMRTGRQLFLLKPPESHQGMTAVAFSPSGWHIAAAVRDGTVRTYDCRLCARADGLVALARTRLARLRG